jgi:hypothetical protein
MMDPHEQVERMFAPPTGESEACREALKECAHRLVDNLEGCDSELIEVATSDLFEVLSTCQLALALKE